jgi:aminopeptidase YwaD
VRIHAERLQQHLAYLTQTLGVRLSGTDNETRAADYIAAQFRAIGATVSEETFPVRKRHVRRLKLHIRLDGRWIAFPGSLLSSTPGTNGKIREAPLVFFEAPAEYSRRDLGYLRGKAVIHLGTHIESRADYRRLMAAKPAFILMVDVRFPGTSPLADGMFPAYTQAIGAVPTVNVAFMDAWRWRIEHATAARLVVDGGMAPATSRNVIADLPGSDPRAGTIVIGAHHDTQADSPGADDNASGVAAIIEIARAWKAAGPSRRGVRLISFGAEEQLSVGSATYVRRHWREIKRSAATMINLDSIGSPMGWNDLYSNGPAIMGTFARRFFESQGLAVRLVDTVEPYGDHFPFTVAGIPSYWLYRVNCTSGRFFHHRPDDDIRRVPADFLARQAQAVGALARHLATVRRLPYPVTIPAALRPAIRRFWKDLFSV